MKRLILTTIFLFLTSAALADVILYLYPSIIVKNNKIQLSTIATIDAGSKEKGKAASLIIPSSMYRDGYVDKRELFAFIKNQFDGPVTIFGSAVKINFLQNKTKPAEYQGIARGKTVRVVYTSGSIRIEVQGKALRSGMPGEVIAVRVNRRIIKAVVIDGEKVKKQL